MLLDLDDIRICSRIVAKSGRADILELLSWTGTFEILAKTLVLAKSLQVDIMEVID